MFIHNQIQFEDWAAVFLFLFGIFSVNISAPDALSFDQNDSICAHSIYTYVRLLFGVHLRFGLNSDESCLFSNKSGLKKKSITENEFKANILSLVRAMYLRAPYSMRWDVIIGWDWTKAQKWVWNWFRSLDPNSQIHHICNVFHWLQITHVCTTSITRTSAAFHFAFSFFSLSIILHFTFLALIQRICKLNARISYIFPAHHVHFHQFLSFFSFSFFCDATSIYRIIFGPVYMNVLIILSFPSIIIIMVLVRMPIR